MSSIKALLHFVNSSCHQKKTIFDWTGDVHDCNILHSTSLNQEFVFFRENVSLQSLYESDEELEGQLQNWENQDKHHSNRDAGFTDLIVFGEDNEDI